MNHVFQREDIFYGVVFFCILAMVSGAICHILLRRRDNEMSDEDAYDLKCGGAYGSVKALFRFKLRDARPILGLSLIIYRVSTIALIMFFIACVASFYF